MPVVDVISAVLLLIGLAFCGLGVLGILRFPDVYTRLHAETKATTFGSLFVVLSVVFTLACRWVAEGEPGQLTLILHALVAVVVLALTNAVGAHAIGRAAHRSGVRPERAVVDHMAEAEAGKAAD